MDKVQSLINEVDAVLVTKPSRTGCKHALKGCLLTS